jgi:hypothetical protein
MMDRGGLGSLLPSPAGLRNSARGWRSFAEPTPGSRPKDLPTPKVSTRMPMKQGKEEASKVCFFLQSWACELQTRVPSP